MKNKTQIIYIHGGSTFRNYKDYLQHLRAGGEISLKKKIKWSNEYLDNALGKEYEVIRPEMPLKNNAKYSEWKIYFERHIPLLNKEVVLIGISLGGIFLAKYLSENKFPKKIISTYLICPPYDDTISKEDLAGGFKLKNDLSLLERNSKNLYLMFSSDDPVVPVSHAKKYEKKLKRAKIFIYKSKNGHFRISKFPEIVKMIKKDRRGI